jgi:hypothetical protein
MEGVFGNIVFFSLIYFVGTLFCSLDNGRVISPVGLYSLRFGKRSRLGQRHGLQNTTLTSFFYKNIYWKVIYVYFYENGFQNKSIDMIFTFVNSMV